MRFCRSLAFAGVIGLATLGVQGTTVILTPSKDNTLFQAIDGDVSSGAGTGLYIGRAGIGGNNSARRPVMAFDLTAIPSGATMTGVTLKLTVTTVSPGAPAAPVTVHRLTADWGEGASNSAAGAGAPALTDDATWLYRFYSTSTPLSSPAWTTAGGDFSGVNSATQTVGGVGDYTWASSSGLIADVQGWLDAPSSNFGWLMLGDESTSGVARKIASRESTSGVTRPTLTVNYSVPEPGMIGVLSAVGLMTLARRRRELAT